jgi:hypothetical protein
MSKHLHIHLTDEQRKHLQDLITSGNAPARTQTRARILLLCDHSQGRPPTAQQIAAALLCNKNTIGNVRRRFVAEGLPTALYDKPRPGQTPKITGEIEAHLIALCCSPPPAGKARWTLRLLAQQMVELGHLDTISDVALMKRLKKTNWLPGG